MSSEEVDKNIELWKIKKLIKSLTLARGYVVGSAPRVCGRRAASSDNEGVWIVWATYGSDALARVGRRAAAGRE